VKSGIYIILNTVNGKCYVGSSVNVFHRLKAHRDALSRGAHNSTHLQGAWNKYGSTSFSFELLKECQPEDLLEHEQFYVDVLACMDQGFGYNLRGPHRLGDVTEETREKMKIARTGTRLSPETRAKLSSAQRRRYLDPAEREKTGSYSRGKPGNRLGIPHTQETCTRIGNTLRGRKFSTQHRRRIGVSLKGVKNALGCKRSIETREKMSCARKKWWEVRRNGRVA